MIILIMCRNTVVTIENQPAISLSCAAETSVPWSSQALIPQPTAMPSTNPIRI